MIGAKRLKLDEDGVKKGVLHPILSDEFLEETPLVEVYVATVTNPKILSKVIVELNTVFPVQELTHLKRVRGKDVLLFPTDNVKEEDVLLVLKSKDFDTSSFVDNVKKVFVAKIPPKIRRQYEKVHKLWPCNFHSDKYLEKLCTNTLFDENELENHKNYMKVALSVAKYSQKNVGAIVVDPKIDSVVAVGYDESHSGPCRHAIMVAIDNVAKTQNGGTFNRDEVIQKTSGKFNLNGCPESLLLHLKEKHETIQFGATLFKGKEELVEPVDGPYLCTGYFVYVTHEPCIMCAMALIHSRANRVFYGTSSSSGGLGTLCKIHTVKDLNHHYEVFAGLLEDECRDL